MFLLWRRSTSLCEKKARVVTHSTHRLANSRDSSMRRASCRKTLDSSQCQTKKSIAKCQIFFLTFLFL
jgi:hypothetical protein